MNQFKYIPIKELFDKNLFSKPTFYKYLKEGKFNLYKLGRKSYVILEEIQDAFTKVTFKTEIKEK